jgi:signal peptidase I
MNRDALGATAAPAEAPDDDFRVIPPPTIRARTVLEIVILLAMLALTANALVSRHSLGDNSMLPTMVDGQSVVVSRLTYQLRPPRRGELVLLGAADNTNRDLLRRIIGLPGETVELRGEADGEGLQVAINGRPLAEPYLTAQLQNNAVITVTSRLRLASGEYYVLADNRASRDDSRSWGPVTSEQLRGRAWITIYPVERLGPVQHDASTNTTR